MGSNMGDEEHVSVDEACEEAEEALKLFLQGKFDEAEAFVEERVRTRERDPEVVPIFTHCHAVILFAKAGITGTEEDRKQAMEMLKEAAAKAREHIPKQGWVSWGMGYFSSPKVQEITEEELSCRIIEAESTYLSAILCFFEESMAAFFRAALLTRTAIGGYRHCHSILKSQQAGSRSKHNVGAVKLGFGGFSLAISLLPPRVLRLLSVLGFPCDRAAGLDSIDQCLQGGGLRAPVGGVLLLSYHVILPSFFSIPQEREEHIASAERVLDILQTNFPDSFFLSFYKGRLERLQRNLTGSYESFQKLEKGLNLTTDSKFFKLRHAWVYELGLSHMLQLEWQAAEKFWEELEQDSVWSKAFFAYLHGVCLAMSGEPKAAALRFGKVHGLMRGTISGRVLAEEQYALRKVKDHALDTEEGVKGLQGQICGVEFLYLWNSFPQMPAAKLEGILHIVEEAETRLNAQKYEGSGDEKGSEDLSEDDEEETPEDEHALCNLIKGTALRELGKLDEARISLEFVRETTCYVQTELFLIPMAAYERALLLIIQHTQRASHDASRASDFDLLLEAKKELALAEGFKQDFNFLWRLLGRVHAARGAIQNLMGEERSTTVEANGEEWKDSEENVEGAPSSDIFFDAL
ncbi:uncharacterized protein [Physcomitrium patens]|uniref:Uncharacterized protein n=1 Tax=Physcomitrium patens TaxID=3218 RepID=A0A2K1IDW8_PHYPA|nr:tetratricopeptide repeat protein 39B-like [Physcomitrium patens]PNR27476.1 hypothetical protein PHYPA_029628 [Physcomitrium patens]|eukprot:XP_024365205.1 tetratricopeptide repeat protein 39B-like [Physcomitrella patens]